MKRIYPMVLLLACFGMANAQTCPDGFTKTTITGSATVFADNSVKDKDRANGYPDNKWASLDNNGDYLILKLEQELTAGQKLTLYATAYNSDPTNGTVSFSSDGVTYTSPQAFSTTTVKPVNTVLEFFPSTQVNYVKINRTAGKLMVDAVVSEYFDCRFEPVENMTKVTCFNTSKYICLNEYLPEDGAFNYVLNATQLPVTGSIEYADISTNLCSDGKPRALTFVYTGKTCSQSVNNQADDACSGSAPLPSNVLIKVTDKSNPFDNGGKIYFSGTVSLNDFFTALSSNGGQTNFPKDIYIHVYNTSGSSALQTIKYKAECNSSNPILLQDQFGGVLLSGYESKTGSKTELDPFCVQRIVYTPEADFSGSDSVKFTICDLNNPPTCHSFMVNIQVLDTNAPSCAPLTIPQANIGLCPGTPKQLCLDDLFGLQGNNGIFGNTSNGYDIYYLNANSGLSGTLQTNEITGESCCDKYGKPTSLVFAYVADNIVANSQPSGKSLVITNSATNGNRVYIVVNNSASDTLGTVYFKGFVDLNQKFTASASSFSSNTYIHILSDDKTTEHQFIQFHTSCSAPIVIGDQFGYIILKESNNSTGSCGGGTPPTTDCCTVNGKPTELTFKYATTNQVNNNQPSGKSYVSTYFPPKYETLYIVVNANASDTTGAYYFKGFVNPNKLFTVYASSFSSNTYIHLLTRTKDTLVQRIQFHTSCSAPIVPGDQFGLMVLMSSANASGNCGFTQYCKNKITYTPLPDFEGDDLLKLLVCVTDSSNTIRCDTAEIKFQMNRIAPVAVNDTFQNLPTSSGSYSAVLDVMANDYHPKNSPFALQKKLAKLPVVANASAIVDNQLKIQYTNSNVTNGMIDSFSYDIKTDCGCDTAVVYLAYGGPVPVTWLSLKATLLENKTVLLNWETAQEINNSGFEIERSGNATDGFEKLGFVKGSGNTSHITAYTFIDNKPLNGDNFYRLKQMDFDGTFAYSKVVFATLSEIGRLHVFPNPTKGQVEITWQQRGIFSSTVNIALVTLTGNTVYQSKVLSNHEKTSLDISTLPDGMYLLHISDQNGFSQVKKLMLMR